MPVRTRVRLAAVSALSLCALMAPAHSIAANAAAQEPSAAQLIERLGLRVAAQPVRERPGWRPPRIVLVSEELHDLLPALQQQAPRAKLIDVSAATPRERSEEHTSELQSPCNLVCRLLLEKKKILHPT